MYFDSFSDFINMGGHAFFVWSAYGFSIFWLAFLLISPWKKSTRLFDAIRSQIKIEEIRSEHKAR